MNISILSNAFEEWVNTFEGISRQCQHISDLSDGIVLFEVAADIDPKWFKLIRSAEMGDNWVHKYNNLKKLHKLVTRYIEEKLGQSLSELDPPNLNAIAKVGDTIEVLKLCELVIAIAVQCERNQHYIHKIQSLPHTSQHALMLSLEQIMAALNSGLRSAKESEIEVIPMEQQIAQLRMECDDLARSKQGLLADYTVMNKKYDDLFREKEEMRLRIRDLEKFTAPHQTGKSRSDILMRTEMDHLRADLQKSEERRQDQELMINSQMKLISDLSRSEAELRERADEATFLKDELEEHKHAVERLQKTENVIEKYKKKLEEGADLRRQIKLVEDQNHDLLERNREIEEEYRKVLAFKSLMESYKEQILVLETKTSALVKDKVQQEHELRKQGLQLLQLEAGRVRDAEQIQVLEETVKELEFSSGGGGQPLSHDLDTDMGGSPHPSNNTMSTTSLKLRISQLEREVETLKEERQETGRSRATVLQHLLDDANKSKCQFEKDYLQEHQAKMTAEGELDRIRSGKGDQSEVAFALRMMLNSCESELFQAKNVLTEKEVVFEQTKKELAVAQSNLSMVGDDKLAALADWKASNSKELTILQREHDEQQQQLTKLEKENKQCLTELNRVLTEKDGLSKLSMEQKDTMLQQERTKTGQMMASMSREQLEDVNRQLEEQLAQAMAQKEQYSVKLKRAKDFTMQQDAIIKDGQPGSPQGELISRDEEIESLKREMRTVQEQGRREQRMIASAWHDHLKRGLREAILSQHQRLAPTSWLGVQRRVFVSQLGSRS
ncbi:hypothetical protein BG005_011381 [Podila minutissima]|nr:hypothetical protein BG005_011381 [Podila minutissima]